METAHQNTKVLYIYDLPKEATSLMIADAFQSKAGVLLKQQPEIKRDPTSQFFKATVRFEDERDYTNSVRLMKYFEIEGKQVRALPHDKSF